MKIIVSVHNTIMEGSKCHMVLNIRYMGTRAFDTNFKARLIVKIDD